MAEAGAGNDVVRLREFHREQTITRGMITESEKNILRALGEQSSDLAVIKKTATDAEATANKARDDVSNMKTWSNRFDGVLGVIATVGVFLGFRQ